jgi:hypothetical protein
MDCHSRPDIPADRLCEGQDLAPSLNRPEGDDVLEDFPEFIIHGEEGKGNHTGCQEYKYAELGKPESVFLLR